MSPASPHSSDSDFRRRIEAIRWYHSLELAPGLVTAGWFDLRDMPGKLPLPSSLAGMRCLDIGTYDGFWAFEMERRGAAEVIAVDVLDPNRWDWPAGSREAVREAIAGRKEGSVGFEIAREALGSRVERLDRSVYELDPGDIGSFDLVYLGSLLLHLRDPVGALQRVHGVCRGRLLTLDAVDRRFTALRPRLPTAELDGLGRPWWWRPNRAALARMVTAAGFEIREGPELVRMPRGRGQRLRPDPRALLRRSDRRVLVDQLLGEPHAWVLATPS